MRIRFAAACCCLLALIGLAVLPPGLGQQPTKPYKVTIVERDDELVERAVPADPKVRVEYQYMGAMSFGVSVEGTRLTAGQGNQTKFMIDGRVVIPSDAGGLMPLPDGPLNKKRSGGQSVWQQGDIRITLVLEAVPGKPWQPRPGAIVQRRTDTLLVKYVIENKGSVPHSVGCRAAIDTLVVENDGALFASPMTHPKQVLDGIAFDGKKLPDFVEVLQRPSVLDPGYKGIFTLKLGNKLEAASKVLLTSYGAATNGNWDVAPQRAGGDSALILYWTPQQIRPGGKREVAFAYGQNLACTDEGKVSVNFGGSFEPGKRFTVTAYVDDPIDGQSLTLLLPKGIEQIDGKATQAVPLPTQTTNSVVMWRCRLLETGTHAIRIRSSAGVTKTWNVTVSPPE